MAWAGGGWRWACPEAAGVGGGGWRWALLEAASVGGGGRGWARPDMAGEADMVIAAIVALAVGTFAFRFAGVVLRDRLDLPAPLRRLLPMAAAALLAALAGTAALTEGGAFAGVARPAGVAVGALLAWRKAPFVVVVVAAASTAALLRLLGLP